LGVIVVVLFAGRWSAGFLAERWWATTLSTPASRFVSNWALLGLLLDAIAVLTASLWFALQALLVTRSVVSVQVSHRVGDLQLRELVPTRLLVGIAVAVGVLLGLIAGAGAHAWREPIVLAWQGVRYGIADPVLGRDLGVYVAQLPAWDLAHRFVALLAVLALALCTTLYSAIGGLRRERMSFTLHPDAQRHLGSLLAVVALVIAAGYLLTPLHIVLHATAAMSPADVRLRIHLAQFMSGIAFATALLTAWWAFRGHHLLLVSTWAVLGLGALAEAVIVPATAADAVPLADQVAGARRLDAIAWGMRAAPSIATSDTVPPVTSLWDDALFSRIIRARDGLLEAATPHEIVVDGRSVPVWLVAAPSGDDAERLDVLAIPDGQASAGGLITSLRSADRDGVAANAFTTVLHPRSRPAASAWMSVADGVTAGAPPRRLLLAWARQAPGMLQRSAGPDFDWHLDPAERADAVLPMLWWTAADIALIGGRPTWIVQGMSVTPDFPLATHAVWQGEDVAGVTPAVIATVDAGSGAIRFYLDPAADSLGHAWARVAAAIIEPVSALPAAVRAALGYDASWFDAQAAVLNGPTWSGVDGGAHAAITPLSAPVWTVDHRPAQQAVFEDPAGDGVTAIATGYRLNGTPQLQRDTNPARGVSSASRVQLMQLWPRSPVLTHLRDSAVAAGDSVLTGPIRWFRGGDGLVAWQPWFARSAHGTTALMWMATALGDRLGGARQPADAWRSVTTTSAAATPESPAATTIVTNARTWMERADSALHRGDMTAFGRAFEELRRTLEAAHAP
jgi:uncharacterized membrane protein (UPF0182 family)